jgi:hypothetical protein
MAILHPRLGTLLRVGREIAGGCDLRKSLFAWFRLETSFRHLEPIPRKRAYSEGVDHADMTLISILAY